MARWDKIVCMSSTETPRLLELGRFIRDLRRRAVLTQDQVAEHLNAALPREGVRRAHTHVSRWERGQLVIDEDELSVVLAHIGADSEETFTAMRLHRDATDPNWLIPGITRPLSVMREYEDSASHIINWQPLEIPGPLQPEAYTEHVIRASGASEDELADWLTFRMARRDSLISGSFSYEAFIGLQAIEYPSTDGPVAIEMLRDLVKMSEYDHITIRIMSPVRRYYPGRGGSFVLIQSETTKPVVHLESYRSSATLTNARDVADYKNAAEQLRRDAMSAGASSRLIADVADKLESESS